jgi:PAS domain-containing protein
VAGFPIVGIGSSAGGLEALQKLFGAMHADSGLAFVVAAHLDPTHESHLSSLLSRCTRMPVAEIENSIKVEPDHVYVIAPDQELTIKGGVPHTNKPTAPRGQRHPVDSFFRSLAEDQGERAIAIVLSGTGSNGSLGLRFIKAEGGTVIAQDPETAGFEGMPRSAIATGIVDLVLPPEKMPEVHALDEGAAGAAARRHRPADRTLCAAVQGRRPARGREEGARATSALGRRGGGRPGSLVHPPHCAVSYGHDRIDGVAVTFTDVTERKRREREVEEAKEFAEAIVEAVRFPLVVLTPELRARSANAVPGHPRYDGGQAFVGAGQSAVGNRGPAAAPGKGSV